MRVKWEGKSLRAMEYRQEGEEILVRCLDADSKEYLIRIEDIEVDHTPVVQEGDIYEINKDMSLYAIEIGDTEQFIGKFKAGDRFIISDVNESTGEITMIHNCKYAIPMMCANMGELFGDTAKKVGRIGHEN